MMKVVICTRLAQFMITIRLRQNGCISNCRAEQCRVLNGSVSAVRCFRKDILSVPMRPVFQVVHCSFNFQTVARRLKRSWERENASFYSSFQLFNLGHQKNAMSLFLLPRKEELPARRSGSPLHRAGRHTVPGPTRAFVRTVHNHAKSLRANVHDGPGVQFHDGGRRKRLKALRRGATHRCMQQACTSYLGLRMLGLGHTHQCQADT